VRSSTLPAGGKRGPIGKSYERVCKNLKKDKGANSVGKKKKKTIKFSLKNGDIFCT